MTDNSDATVFEEPSGGDESGFLTDHVHRCCFARCPQV